MDIMSIMNIMHQGSLSCQDFIGYYQTASIDYDLYNEFSELAKLSPDALFFIFLHLLGPTILGLITFTTKIQHLFLFSANILLSSRLLSFRGGDYGRHVFL